MPNKPIDTTCDINIRTGKFKVYMAIFGNNSPKLFNIDNPKQTLALSLNPAKRKTQVKVYLGVNPQGLVSLAELHKHYKRGVTVDGKNLSMYEAVAHILSRTLAIPAYKVQEVIEDRFKKGYESITFVTDANLRNAETKPDSKWQVLPKLFSEGERLDGLNKLLKEAGSKYRAVSPSTYMYKVIGA
jgi:hypothetical protein